MQSSQHSLIILTKDEAFQKHLVSMISFKELGIYLLPSVRTSEDLISSVQLMHPHILLLEGSLLTRETIRAIQMATIGRFTCKIIVLYEPQDDVQTIQNHLSTSAAVPRDVTAERERTEEELRIGATRAVRDLAAGVAHEIGNPLNALSLNLQLIRRANGDSEEIEECIRQVERLSGIIHGFLQALRPSKPNLVRGSVADPINKCLTAMRPQFEERSVSVTLNLPSALPSVALDPAQMEQVFFNLLKNALEALRDGGSIDISLSSDDNDVITTVRDDGHGMSPEQVAHLFEPYRTSKEHGTGLGLMISARIVRDHGGTISVESEPEKGTAFTIRLPRIERRIRALKG